jgi:hypothetical protein
MNDKLNLYIDRENPEDNRTMYMNDLASVEQSNFNPNLSTKLYAIGWNDDGAANSLAYPTRDGRRYLKIP